jgi:spore coat polysaccharide biosynthesis predicted glycosyltransferase SpsG
MPSNILVVIPAPLHAAGLPRAALRSLAGRTLLKRALETASGAVSSQDQIAVLVDDDEVALFAERQGCQVHPLPAGYDTSGQSLAASVDGVTRQIESTRPDRFAAVMLLHPTAALVRSADLTRAVDRLFENGAASVVSEPMTGTDSGNWPSVGFAVSRRSSVNPERFLGDRVEIAEVPPERTFSIRSGHDWWVCERLLQRKRVVFVVIGYPAVGLGHVSRAATVAHELMHHDVHFLCPRGSELAATQLAARALPVHLHDAGDLADCVLALQPDLVVNDILNTDREYVERLKTAGAAVVNFEDLGSGARVADLVINAIFMEPDVCGNHLNGPAYFCIRDEFLHAPSRADRVTVREILVTFGGTDPSDNTSRVARLILPRTRALGIHVSFVTGPGYAHLDRLQEILAGVPAADATLAHDTRRMSDYMARADFAFSSAGRTVFELAAMGVPAVIVAANEREESHTFACEDNGFVYLGGSDQVTDTAIVSALERLIESAGTRRQMSERMQKWDFRKGRERVLGAIEPFLVDDRKGVRA